MSIVRQNFVVTFCVKLVSLNAKLDCQKVLAFYTCFLCSCCFTVKRRKTQFIFRFKIKDSYYWQRLLMYNSEVKTFLLNCWPVVLIMASWWRFTEESSSSDDDDNDVSRSGDVSVTCRSTSSECSHVSSVATVTIVCSESRDAPRLVTSHAVSCSSSSSSPSSHSILSQSAADVTVSGLESFCSDRHFEHVFASVTCKELHWFASTLVWLSGPFRVHCFHNKFTYCHWLVATSNTVTWQSQHDKDVVTFSWCWVITHWCTW